MYWFTFKAMVHANDSSRYVQSKIRLDLVQHVNAHELTDSLDVHMVNGDTFDVVGKDVARFEAEMNGKLGYPKAK